MIRIYADWNVMAQMKNGQHPELLTLLLEKDHFMNILSTAHIGDLTEAKDDDLEFITKLTRDYCAYTEHRDVVIRPNSPNELFAQRKSPAGILKAYDKAHVLDETLADLFGSLYQDSKTAESMNRLYPGLADNLSFKGLVAASLEQFRRLNEEQEYGDWRKLVQGGMSLSRDKMFISPDPILLLSTQMNMKIAIFQMIEKLLFRNSNVFCYKAIVWTHINQFAAKELIGPRCTKDASKSFGKLGILFTHG